jgi:hypothetical protein
MISRYFISGSLPMEVAVPVGVFHVAAVRSG